MGHLHHCQKEYLPFEARGRRVDTETYQPLSPGVGPLLASVAGSSFSSHTVITPCKRIDVGDFQLAGCSNGILLNFSARIDLAEVRENSSTD